MQVKHCAWQTLPPHGERWGNGWLQQQVSAKWSLGSSSCYRGPYTQRILNLLEYLQKAKVAPNFSGTDSADFTKAQIVPLHRQKGCCGEELNHPNLLARGSVVPRLLIPRLLRIKSGPSSTGLKTHSWKRRMGKATQSIYCRCLKQLLWLQKKYVGLCLRAAPKVAVTSCMQAPYSSHFSLSHFSKKREFVWVWHYQIFREENILNISFPCTELEKGSVSESF